ncbi:unnamed protein product [Meganyctiphanes norvegica]|uniref:Uncharacterized protein n=1 Tax=Meganyctiphanes norvegica TaxID=48144 RepID=A0AAV2QCC8_MEGNR
MSSPRTHLLALILLLAFCCSTCTASQGGCLNYGHSCLGAHGKRSGTARDPAAPLAQKGALLEVLLAALLAPTAAHGQGGATHADHRSASPLTEDTTLQENPTNSQESKLLSQQSQEFSVARPSFSDSAINSRLAALFPIDLEVLNGLDLDDTNIKPRDISVYGDDTLYLYDTEDLQKRVDSYDSNPLKPVSSWSPRRMQALLKKQGIDLSKLGNWIRR